VVEWIPRYNGGHEQTFNIQYRIINESKIWTTQEIPKYNRQTYTLSGLQSDTWYELRMLAKNEYDESSVTDMQSILTDSTSVEKGMPSGVSVFCYLSFLSSHDHKPCELLSWVSVCPFVSFSHLNLL
jgi:hypothetical protein